MRIFYASCKSFQLVYKLMRLIVTKTFILRLISTVEIIINVTFKRIQSFSWHLLPEVGIFHLCGRLYAHLIYIEGLLLIRFPHKSSNNFLRTYLIIYIYIYIEIPTTFILKYKIYIRNKTWLYQYLQTITIAFRISLAISRCVDICVDICV